MIDLGGQCDPIALHFHATVKLVQKIDRCGPLPPPVNRRSEKSWIYQW